MVSVPRIWPGETVVCLGRGPSLTQEDVDLVRGKARVIAINSAVTLAPWADVLYACDHGWWRRHPEAETFAGLKYSLTAKPQQFPTVQILQYSGEHGFDPDPCYLRTGSNSGYQAIHFAVHAGATRILLLGYDMQRASNGRTHFDSADRHAAVPFVKFLKAFPTLVKPLQRLGVVVINCSRVSKLTCFPKMSLEQALMRAEVAA